MTYRIAVGVFPVVELVDRWSSLWTGDRACGPVVEPVETHPTDLDRLNHRICLASGQARPPDSLDRRAGSTTR